MAKVFSATAARLCGGPTRWPWHWEIWTKTVTLLVVLLFIPITIAGAYSMPPRELAEPPERPDEFPNWSEYDIVRGTLRGESGYTDERSSDYVPVTLDVTNVRSVTFTLTWTDEADAGVRYVNEPDSFELEVFPPNNTDASGGPTTNPSGGQGRISVTISYGAEGNKDPYFNGTGEYQVTVVCNLCGDQVLWRPSAGLFDQLDTGNAWTLDIEYEYYQKPE